MTGSGIAPPRLSPGPPAAGRSRLWLPARWLLARDGVRRAAVEAEIRALPDVTDPDFHAAARAATAAETLVHAIRRRLRAVRVAADGGVPHALRRAHPLG